jgi:hypothetical protein
MQGLQQRIRGGFGRPTLSRCQLPFAPVTAIRRPNVIANASTDTGNKPTVPDSPPSAAGSTSSTSRTPSQSRSPATGAKDDDGFSWGEFIKSDLPSKLAILLGLIAVSRLGVYIRLPGVDVDGFGQMMSNSGLLGYVDTLSGGSISKVGLFSLGIIPYINSSIVLQLLAAAFPSLKKLQREEGAQGRARFQYYQKLGAFVFAIVQVIVSGFGLACRSFPAAT